ncbi:drug resistance transporter, EmrB/QacA subfamily [Jatrophihabitans endophyticus]|uniref:Drug resistance transporter, EmrB/QacA subfamily n=1 Tax=Jatrophihabitans endophyticus TaxID=1206085 RepID=A0A1M5GWW1_9ACTN|nr:MFS transporter [Jatrophihabitans endophyticus]SHG08211.1 drug resistance transporter, EmrB/QacA subfamily [Jatrophihabitans endophyticus]
MRKWLPLLTVCLGTFMLLIDVTIVNVALPDMATDLQTSFASLQWVVDAYALVLAALVLGTGSIADLVGHRRAYIAGLGLFAVSSLVCGLAPNAGALVAARAVQGLGAAAMFATTFALLNSSYHGRDRGTAYGIWGAVAGASAAVGPIVGGLLTEGVSWRWIFFVNLPVSLVAIALCVVVLRDSHAPVRARVDVPGIVAFTAAAASLTYGLIEANENGWGEVGSWGWLVATPVLLAVFVAVELRTRAPMLDLSLLRNGPFVGVLLAGMFVTLCAFASFTYTTIWLQSVVGLSPIESGLVGLPLSLASFGVSAAIGRFLHGTRPGPIIGGGLLLIGLGGLLGGMLVHGSATWPALLPGFFLVGVGVGLATPTLSSAAMSAVPVQRGGMAAGAVNTARQLGFALGIAGLGSVFAARSAHVLADHRVPASDAVSRAVSGGQAHGVLAQAPAAVRGALDDAIHAASVQGVQWTLLVSGVLGVLAALAVFVLVRPPAEAGRHEPAALGADELDAAPA